MTSPTYSPRPSWATAPQPARAEFGSVRDRYLEDRVSTASPAELTAMLLDGATGAAELAAQLLEAGDRHSALAQLQRAQAIVLELRMSLSQAGGEVSITLDSIWSWCFTRLLEAGSSGDPAPCREALTSIREIRDAWFQAFLGEPAT